MLLLLICFIFVLSHIGTGESQVGTFQKRDEGDCLDKGSVALDQCQLETGKKIRSKNIMKSLENPISFLTSTLDILALVLANFFVSFFLSLLTDLRLLISRLAFVQ